MRRAATSCRHGSVSPFYHCHLLTSDVHPRCSSLSSLLSCPPFGWWSRARVRPTTASQDAGSAVSLLIHRITSWTRSRFPLQVTAEGSGYHVMS